MKRRIQAQGYTIEEIEVLEEHTDIHRVSLREHQLQREYGYKVDTVPYSQTISIVSQGGKIGGKIGIASGHLQRIRKLSNIARNKRVAQYTKDGKFIKEFMSQIQAANELNLQPRCISLVCNNKRKYTGGFVFKYVNELAC